MAGKDSFPVDSKIEIKCKEMVVKKEKNFDETDNGGDYNVQSHQNRKRSGVSEDHCYTKKLAKIQTCDLHPSLADLDKEKNILDDTASDSDIILHLDQQEAKKTEPCLVDLTAEDEAPIRIDSYKFGSYQKKTDYPYGVVTSEVVTEQLLVKQPKLDESHLLDVEKAAVEEDSDMNISSSVIPSDLFYNESPTTDEGNCITGTMSLEVTEHIAEVEQKEYTEEVVLSTAESLLIPENGDEIVTTIVSSSNATTELNSVNWNISNTSEENTVATSHLNKTRNESSTLDECSLGTTSGLQNATFELDETSVDGSLVCAAIGESSKESKEEELGDVEASTETVIKEGKVAEGQEMAHLTIPDDSNKAVVPRNASDAYVIPSDVSVDNLNKAEQDLRQSASRIRNELAPIEAERNKQTAECQQLEYLLATRRADLAAKTETVNLLKQKFATHLDEVEKYQEESNNLSSKVSLNKKNLHESQIHLYELQISLCKDQIALLAENSPTSPLHDAITKNQKEIDRMEREIDKRLKILEKSKQALLVAQQKVEQLTQDDVKQKLIQQVSVAEEECKKSAFSVVGAENKLQEGKTRLESLKMEYSRLSYNFVELEKTMIKIKMCRKLKTLEAKQEKLLVDSGGRREQNLEVVGTSSTLQFSSQMTTFISSDYPQQCPTNGGQPSGVAEQRITSLQAFAITNRNVPHQLSWNQPLFPFHQSFSNPISPWFPTQQKP